MVNNNKKSFENWRKLTGTITKHLNGLDMCFIEVNLEKRKIFRMFKKFLTNQQCSHKNEALAKFLQKQEKKKEKKNKK